GSTQETTNNTIMDAELFITLTKAQVLEEFNRIQSVISADLLRHACFQKIASSHEEYHT
ncbi:unnamed protein product, partial [Rotaria sp. Silwood2]